VSEERPQLSANAVKINAKPFHTQSGGQQNFPQISVDNFILPVAIGESRGLLTLELWGSSHMTKANILELWETYSDILWEPGSHKETCRGYVHEIQEVIVRNRLTRFDNRLLDVVTSSFRAKGNKNSTVNRKMSCLSKLLRKHYRNGAIDRLPDFRKLPERNGRIRFLSHMEEISLLGNLDSIDPAYGALARFLADTGARVGEALQLRWCDVQEAHVTFWETKGNQPRTVPLTRRAISVLDGRREDGGIGPFCEVRYANFRNAWLRAKASSGLGRDPQVVPHVLRHTCASRLAQNGVDIKRIQEFLGHRTLAMTLRYAHLAPRHLDVCVEALDALASERRTTSGQPITPRQNRPLLEECAV
jgi:integrase